MRLNFSRSKRNKSHLEGFFEFQLKAWGLTNYVRELRFDPERRSRFDFAFPKHKVAVEIEGGNFVRGRHARGAGRMKDQEKHNRATRQGWRVFYYSTMEQMRDFYNDYAELLAMDEENNKKLSGGTNP